MKKFDPEKEINDSDLSKNNLSMRSKIESAFIPLLVIGCSLLAMVGVTFSSKLVADDEKGYEIVVKTTNGEKEEYHFKTNNKSFSMTITGSGAFADLFCTSGSATYDVFTDKITFPYINSDTECYITFKGDNGKYLSIDGLRDINDNVGVSSYYPADADNNYLLFEGMMFRIIRVNGDGSLRIMLDKSDLVFNYGATNMFDNSNLKRVLNMWFDENFKGNKYVVIEDFDITNYTEVEIENLINIEGTYDAYVGTISVREAALILKDSKEDYLGSGLLLANANGATDVYSVINGDIEPAKVDVDLTIKPVINIMVEDLEGIGTIDDPYTIKED